MTYGRLNETNPEYKAETWATIEALYVGGFGIQKDASKHVQKLFLEADDRYAERCKIASYQPYFTEIIDQFVADVFVEPLNIKPQADADNPDTPGEEPDRDYYSSFAANCDRRGQKFAGLLEITLREALKKGVAIVALDAPNFDDALVAETRADEEKSGALDLYAYDVPVEGLLSWEPDNEGGLKWAIIKTVCTPRESPMDVRDTVIETFTVWRKLDGVVDWTRYECRHKIEETPKNESIVDRVGGGTTSFKRVPILRLELPLGLWVGNKIGTQALEHWNRYSALVGAENRSLCAIPYIKRGSELGAPGGSLPSATQQDEQRGSNPVARFHKKGYVEIGSGDELGFAEPSGHCYTVTADQLDKLKNAMFAVSHQMAVSIQPTKAALQRSGLSKQKDEDAKTKVLRVLGAIIRTFATLVYTTVSEARGENVVWNAHGLEDYVDEDRQQLIEEAVRMDTIPIPSVTFRRHYKREIARKLLGSAEPGVLDTINNEINEGVDAEEAMRSMQADAQKDAILNPQDHAPQGAVRPVQPVKPVAPVKLGAGDSPQGSAASGGQPTGPSASAPLGDGGQPELPEGAHLQTGQHVDAHAVWDLLKDDYEEKDIGWVLQIPWIGPVEVPLGSIDSSNRDAWAAVDDTKKVDRFADKIANEGFSKPVILVNAPSNSAKMRIVDGHHRYLAYEQNGQAVMAYVGQVGTTSGPWDTLHDREVDAQKPSASGTLKSKQVSRQSSRQK